MKSFLCLIILCPAFSYGQMNYGGRVSDEQFNITFYGGLAGFLLIILLFYNWEWIADLFSAKREKKNKTNSGS